MDPSIISALSALIGAIIGGFTSVLASWSLQRGQARARWRAGDYFNRQELYREFIARAAKCYADALQHDEPDIPLLIELHAHLDTMRVISSPKVIETALEIRRKILDTFLDPNKSFPELRELLAEGSVDILASFAEASRAELESIQASQF